MYHTIHSRPVFSLLCVHTAIFGAVFGALYAQLDVCVFHLLPRPREGGGTTTTPYDHGRVNYFGVDTKDS